MLNCLSAGVGSVIDKELVLANAAGDDLGHEWLKSHSEGSGAFQLKGWKASESVSMEANPAHRFGEPAMRRVIVRHIPEPSAQRLLLEKGDIDIARNLSPDQI